MSNELDILLDEYVESEIECNRNRQIYSELEQIFMKKKFSDGVQGATAQLDNLNLHETTPSTSLIKKDSALKITKSRSSVSDKTSWKKHQLPSTPDENCFVTLKKRMLQFESYQKMLKQAPNKSATDFLDLLEAQNCELATNLSQNESDS